VCLYFIISHTSVMFLNDFHINCLKKSQNNTCVCDALGPIVYICSPCVVISHKFIDSPIKGPQGAYAYTIVPTLAHFIEFSRERWKSHAFLDHKDKNNKNVRRYLPFF
jgi:hypothetical protein